MSPTRFPQADEVVAHKLRVERLARNLAPSEHDAEDLAQEVWVAALRARRQRIDHFGGWTRAVTVRLAGKLAVRGRRRRDWEAQAARPEDEPSNLGSIERRSLREYLERRIGELKNPYREVLRLRYLDELGTEEIAGRLGRTGGTVRSQIKRGLEQLRERINGDLDADRGLRGLGLLAFFGRRGVQALLVGSVAVGTLAVWLGSAGERERNVRGAALGRPDIVPSPRTLVGQVPPDARAPASSGPSVGPPERVVRGRVVDHDGTPVAAAEVWLGAPGSDPAFALLAGLDGTFALFASAELDPASWIGARAEGRFPSPELRLDTVLRAEESELELVLPPASPAPLIVEVLDSDGRPVRRASVRIVPGYTAEPFLGPNLELRRRPRGTQGTTDANGILQTVKLGGRVSYVHVRSPHHPPVIAKTRRPFLLPERVVVRLPRPAALAGGVRRPDGTPAGGALLTLVHESGLTPVQQHAAADGSFQIADLTPGPYTLSVVGQGVPSLVREVVLAEGETADLELLLRDEHSVAGIAVDAHGTPLAGRRVTLGTRATRTDGEGRFTFGAVAPGEHVARLHEEGQRGLPVALVEGCRPGDVAVRLLARPGDAALTGTLVGGGSDSRLALRLPHVDEEVAVETNARGEFSVNELPAGTYRFVVRDPDLGASPLGRCVLEPGENLELGELAVPQPGTLELRLSVPGGIGRRIPQLSLRSELLRLRCRTQFEPDGRGGGILRAERVPPGTYDLFLTTPDFEDVFASLEIRSGQDVVREVALRPGFRRDFAIDAPPKVDELPGLVLRGPTGTRRVYSDADRRPDDREGLLLSLNLAPGRYTLAADEEELEGELTFSVEGPIGKPAQNPLQLELRLR